ncbi:hypothetical protein [Cellulosimicrobium marinum]|uniref:hypothetical protein n=1 Tax=Cellulosimicrobium marinum TaxID=1638992 RepID=UPI001E486B40|nr:hypothetical protein [Cellulosimicrobium marinum]MCB7134959.1 hypothetical protein [Cellulosimicrobium marinum]
MLRRILGLAGAAAALALAAMAALVLILRTRWEPGIRFLHERQRAFRDRAVARSGRPGDAHAVVHHVGRTSGRAYATPIGVERTPAGFVVTLPYGSGTDWARNVLAAGGGELTTDGETVRVTSPRVLGRAEAAPLLSTRERVVGQVFGVTEYLLLQLDPGQHGVDRL